MGLEPGFAEPTFYRTCLRRRACASLAAGEGSLWKHSCVMDRTDPTFDRRLYPAMGILAVAIVFVGFSRTFYLREWFESPPLSALRYLHGTLMTCW